MARRKFATPNALSGYSGDFTAGVTSINVGQPILISHFNETVGHINRINPTGVSSEKTYALQAASSILAVAESVSPVDIQQASCSGG